MTESNSDWPIPEGLSDLGRQAAEKIVEFLQAHDATYHGGGGQFYTPQEWVERGEAYARDSLLVVTHDGGDHAGAFNIAYEQYKFREELIQCLAPLGVFVEQSTSWYSGIYPA